MCTELGNQTGLTLEFHEEWALSGVKMKPQAKLKMSSQRSWPNFLWS